jgi:benzylsuccinate CoA-transferase BbsF subunit
VKGAPVRRARGGIAGGIGVSSPHGVYPTVGKDRWIAIAVQTNAQWQALCALMQDRDSSLLQDTRFAEVEHRLAHRAKLDASLASWTRQYEAQALEAILQVHGIAASAVLTMEDLYSDPQLLHRSHFIALSHPIHLTTTVEGSRFQLSDTPAHIVRSAPILGCDTSSVLTTILGYDSAQIEKLVSQKTLS